MNTRILLASAFVAATTLAHPVLAAPVTARQVDKDYSQLSRDGLRAFADVDVARKAILAKDKATATDALADANHTLERAGSDNRQFLKAEIDLHPAQAVPEGHSGRLPSSTAQDAPVLWLPILGEYMIAPQSDKTPGQKQAVTEANDLLKKGKTRDAAVVLQKAGVDVQFVLALAPQQMFTADVYRASVLFEGGKTDEAVAALTDGLESLRFVSQDNVLASSKVSRQASSTTAAPTTAAPTTAAPTTAAPTTAAPTTAAPTTAAPTTAGQ
ncbi:YfdX family protein [Acetobacter conturbans]|uniref:YfdX family protein n=1 Tax=Acetobacter conturbans TaxID=1737472 RepID=A0ABX0K2G5_9PROT|nr:YfdX family protein [Acetobacter conturbans]NHN88207.1 YfdX family protein [Acetobacter conturbans]